MRKIVSLSLVLFLMVFCLNSFVYAATPPTVTTGNASVQSNSATLNGTVNTNGGAAVTDCGFYWGTSSGNMPNKVQVGSNVNTPYTLSRMISSLTPGTYYFQAYATNSAGTVKGTARPFTIAQASQAPQSPQASQANPPTVTTGNASVQSNSATLNGTVNTNGGTTVTDCGFYWGTSPSNMSNKVQIGSNVNTPYTLSRMISNLTPGTTYYFQAYASNSAGTAKGSAISFVINQAAIAKPVVTIIKPTSNSSYPQGQPIPVQVSATGGTIKKIEIYVDGKLETTITNSGSVNYNIDSNKYSINKHNISVIADNGTTGGTYVDFIITQPQAAGAAPNQPTQTPKINLPTVATSNASVQSNSANLNGSVTANGGAPVTDCGFYWGTNSGNMPNKVPVGSNVSTPYILSKMISSLTPGTYYFQSYATNSAGTAKGNVVSFTVAQTTPTSQTNQPSQTPKINPPTVTTSNASVQSNSATLNGSVTVNGGAAVTDCGFYWGTNSGNMPNKVPVGSNVSTPYTLSKMISNLTPGTYYFQSYATNSAGTVKGNVVSFIVAQTTQTNQPSQTSKVNPPAVLTGNVTVQSNSASLIGSITNAGGVSITDCGFYWGTTSNNMPNKVTATTGNTSYISGTIPNLAPGTYYVQMYATNSAGTTKGNVVSFVINQTTAQQPLTVTSTTPSNNATGINVSNNTLTVTFSENISAGTAYESITVQNTSNGQNVMPISKQISGNRLTISRNGTWSDNTKYTVTIPQGAVKTSAGVTSNASNFSFTTQTPAQQPLTVTSTTPSNNATGINVNSNTLTVTFSENISAGTAYESIMVQNTSNGQNVTPISKQISGNRLTISRNGAWSDNTKYTVTIPQGAVKTSAGVTSNASNFSFTTQTPAQQPLTVTSTTPSNNATGISVNSNTLTVTFSENISAGTAYESITVQNTSNGQNVMPINKQISGNRLTISRNGTWSDNTKYTVTIPRGAVKTNAGAASNASSFSFTTQAPTQQQPLTVTSTTPANNTTEINVSTNTLTVTFSDNILAGTTYESIAVQNTSNGQNVTPINKQISGKILTISRNGTWSDNTKYTVTIPQGAVKNNAGEGSTAYSFSFTTHNPSKQNIPPITPQSQNNERSFFIEFLKDYKTYKVEKDVYVTLLKKFQQYLLKSNAINEKILKNHQNLLPTLKEINTKNVDDVVSQTKSNIVNITTQIETNKSLATKLEFTTTGVSTFYGAVDIGINIYNINKDIKARDLHSGVEDFTKITISAGNFLGNIGKIRELTGYNSPKLFKVVGKAAEVAALPVALYNLFDSCMEFAKAHLEFKTTMFDNIEVAWSGLMYQTRLLPETAYQNGLDDKNTEDHLLNTYLSSWDWYLDALYKYRDIITKNTIAYLFNRKGMLEHLNLLIEFLEDPKNKKDAELNFKQIYKENFERGKLERERNKIIYDALNQTLNNINTLTEEKDNLNNSFKNEINSIVNQAGVKQ